MAESYVTKTYLATQFQNYSEVIKEKFALKEEVSGGGALEEDLVATTAIGSVTSGKTYTKGTPLEDIIRDILTTYQKAGLAVTLNPSKEIYDVVTETLSSINVTASATKGTGDITSVTFYIDGVEQQEITNGVAEGGSFSYAHTFDTPQQATFTVKVTVTDGKQATTVTKDIVFIGKSYYGTVGEDVTTPTEFDVKNLEFNTLKNNRKLIYSGIQVEYGKVLYAYPKSLGALTKIVDADNRDYTNSYTRSEIEVDGIPYYAYLLTDAMGTDDGYQSFT